MALIGRTEPLLSGQGRRDTFLFGGMRRGIIDRQLYNIYSVFLFASEAVDIGNEMTPVGVFFLFKFPLLIF